MTDIIETFRSAFGDRDEEKQQKRRREAEARLRRDIQVMEYNSDFYLSFRGIPLVRVDDQPDGKDSVSNARARALDYIMDESVEFSYPQQL